MRTECYYEEVLQVHIRTLSSIHRAPMLCYCMCWQASIVVGPAGPQGSTQPFGLSAETESASLQYRQGRNAGREAGRTPRGSEKIRGGAADIDGKAWGDVTCIGPWTV